MGGLLVDVRTWIGLLVEFRSLGTRFAEHRKVPLLKPEHWAVEIDGALHTAVALTGRIKLAAAEANHRREMSARAASDDTDVRGINAQALRVRPQPAHGNFAIVQILRPRWTWVLAVCEHVVDAHADIAIQRKRGADVDLACRTLLTA